jgi:type II secretory pathway pseudopilin PulG
MIIRCVKKRFQAATTLVDVILAVGIIAIMAGGMIGSITYGFYVMQMARENQRATQIILERIEAIRLYNWSQVKDPNFIPATFTDVYDPQAAPGAQGVVYSGTVTKSSVNFTNSYSQYMVQLKLDLTWKTRNVTRYRTLTTYIARDGIQNYVY